LLSTKGKKKEKREKREKRERDRVENCIKIIRGKGNY